jgi:hypothetical protein
VDIVILIVSNINEKIKHEPIELIKIMDERIFRLHEYEYGMKL